MVSQAEARELLESSDLVGLGMRADEVRRRLHPGGVASYAIDRKLDCGAVEERLFEEIQEAIDNGGTGIALTGLHARQGIEDLLREIRRRFGIHCEAAFAWEISELARTEGRTLGGTIAGLRDAGLDSISGSAEMADVHRAAHGLGMRTTVTLEFGGEAFAYLELARRIQDETGGIAAFIPTAKEDATAVEYLKALAVSRIYLENIVNIQSSWAPMGLKTCQVGLRFGGNDIGGVTAGATEEELRRLIRDAGFVPKQRDTLYSQYFLN